MINFILKMVDGFVNVHTNVDGGSLRCMSRQTQQGLEQICHSTRISLFSLDGFLTFPTLIFFHASFAPENHPRTSDSSMKSKS